MNSRRIIIAGGSGFIGRAIANARCHAGMMSSFYALASRIARQRSLRRVGRADDDRLLAA